jgi:ketosteroid isomerase-like protein
VAERDILLLPCTLRNLAGQHAFLWSTTTAARDRDDPWVVEVDGQGATHEVRGVSMDNGSLLRNLYDAFARGDIPAVLGAMRPDIHWHQAEGNPYRPTGEPWVGPDAVLHELFLKLGAEWDGFSIQTKAFHDAGDSVIVEARYSGTYRPTGKSMDAQVCHVWDVRDGKVSRFQQYVDTAQLQGIMRAG